MTQDSRF